MIKNIKKKVLEKCKKHGWKWEPHVRGVVKYALLLADKLDADKEVVELAAWLHDIHKMEVGRDLHHVHGSEKAADMMKKEGYSDEIIEKVKHCIITILLGFECLPNESNPNTRVLITGSSRGVSSCKEVSPLLQLSL